ncbi:MAG TPA: CpsB/CapC family capsule biosynthesis tyrosine phosphatase [Anaeromyxobacteraceae bacterium]|nr:CpsB/CapC family capsule biosynthesis tyrosine phosphatase [Anaeromyxobacteraceae bacterium]
MGYVDLHCHLLWDLDDGCRTPEETLWAARALSAVGYTDAAPTPHAQVRYGGGDVRLARERLEAARALLASEGVELALHASAENQLDEAYVVRAEAGEARGLGTAGRFALVELPFVSLVPGVDALVRRLRAAGLVPIFAHPERCAEFERPGRAEAVVALGAALQLNVGALTGRHGRQARLLAERFLDRGLYAVAGTDLHAPDAADEWIADALETLAERAGGAVLRRLCDENPRRALAGEDLL